MFYTPFHTPRNAQIPRATSPWLDICPSSVSNFLHVTPLPHRIMRSVLGFWNICAPLIPSIIKPFISFIYDRNYTAIAVSAVLNTKVLHVFNDAEIKSNKLRLCLLSCVSSLTQPKGRTIWVTFETGCWGRGRKDQRAAESRYTKHDKNTQKIQACSTQDCDKKRMTNCSRKIWRP